MSNRERANQLLNSVPDYKIEYVIAYLEGITAGTEQEMPNKETREAMKELNDEGGTVFHGDTKDFLSELLTD